MKIWETIKRFKLRQLFVLSKTLLLNPVYILPTYSATKETLKICDEKFGEAHHQNNKANGPNRNSHCTNDTNQVMVAFKRFHAHINYPAQVVRQDV